MRLLESVMSAGVVAVGVILLGVGYFMSQTTIAAEGSSVTGAQLKEVGFLLVFAGFAAWVVMNILKRLEIT